MLQNIILGIATTSIGQARKAAEAIHAHLQGTELPNDNNNGEMIRADKLKIDWTLRISERTCILFCLSHVVELRRFGGGNIQFQMLQ